MTNYPTDFPSLSAWASRNKIPQSEARERLAQYGILRAVASSNELSRSWAFKGGNALDFVWMPNRSTKDLDFSSLDNDITADQLRARLDGALTTVTRDLGIHYRVQKVARDPKSENLPHATFSVRVGYAMPDAIARLVNSVRDMSTSSGVSLDVSINELVCDCRDVDVLAPNPLLVCTREDIFAEKLRSLLQQVVRNRSRKQDLLDLAYQIKNGPALDIPALSRHLDAKARARDIVPTKLSFRDPALWARAQEDYNELETTARNEFIPFDQAKTMVLGFVDQLVLPDS